METLYLLHLLLSLSGTLLAVKQPNIVLMLADDLGWGDVPWNGAVTIAPNLANLAYSGVILDRHYVQPICTPTRAALMTGKYPIRLGMQHAVILWGEPWGLGTEEVLVSDHLSALGYAVHGVGKWHLGFCSWAHTPAARGFDSFYGYWNGDETYSGKITHGFYDFRLDTKDANGTLNDQVLWGANETYSTYLYAERASKVIQEHDTEKPLFLYFPIQSVHYPSEVPSKYYDLYEGVVNNTERRTLNAMVTAMDDVVGTVVSELKKKDMWDNTIFIFFSDNGGPVPPVRSNGQTNFPLRGGKATLWEGGIRSSSFVHSPLLPHSFVNRELIHVTDWLPTLVHLASCGPHDLECKAEKTLVEGIDGINQWATIIGAEKSGRTEFLVNIDEWEHNSAALRMGPWKLYQGYPGSPGPWIPPPRAEYGNQTMYHKVISDLIENIEKFQDGFCETPDNHEDSPTTVRLFNVDTDPSEIFEVSKDHPDIVDQMLEKINVYSKEAVPIKKRPIDPNSDPKKFGGVWKPWLETCP